MTKPAHQNRQVTGAITNRPNEGVVLDVRVDTKPGVDGRSVTYMGAEFSKAPVPDRKFTADVCFLLVSPHTLKMVFGQDRIDGKGLRSAIVVQMARQSGVNFVHTMSSMRNPSLIEIAQMERIPTEPLSPVAEEPSQALSLSANTPIAGVSGHEACIDFYQASPFSMAVAARAQKLALEPVVRVTLRTSLLLGLLAELRELLNAEIREITKLIGVSQS